MGKTYSSLIFGTVAGLVMALAQPFFSWWFLVFFGLVLIFLGVKIIARSSAAFNLGYFSGLAYYLIDFKWYWAVYPLKHLGFTSKPLAFFFVFLTWIITAGSMALLWGLAVWLFYKIDRQISASALLIFPSIFTLAEYARSFLIALVWTGRQTPIGPFWTLGNLAYNFHQSFLVLKLASWFGIYGLDWLIIFLSLVLFIFLESRAYRKFLILLMAIFVLFYWPFPKNHSGQAVETALIQTNTPSQPVYTAEQQASFFATQLKLLRDTSQKFPQTKIIVFPEESDFFTQLTIFKNTAGVSQYFADLFPNSVLVIDNSRLTDNSHFKARTIFLDTKKGVIGSYDKYLITPGAEYIPWLFREIDQLLAIDSPQLREIEEYQTGGEWPKAIDAGNFKITSLVCADLLSPHLAQAGVTGGSNLLISQASFAFGRNPKDLESQDLAAAEFRAAEAGRYLIKASNAAPSYLISNQGKLLKIAPNSEPQILTGSVVLKAGKTLYNKVGDGPIILASFGVLVAGLFFRKNEYN